jgi:hypothetical protein
MTSPGSRLTSASNVVFFDLHSHEDTLAERESDRNQIPLTRTIQYFTTFTVCEMPHRVLTASDRIQPDPSRDAGEAAAADARLQKNNQTVLHS